jgi:hypothetical protein
MTDTYRPGDIAMVDGKPAVWKRLSAASSYGADQYRWEFIEGGWNAEPAEVGPVLGNVGDIAVSEQQRYEAAMDDYAANTTHGNTWIEDTE